MNKLNGGYVMIDLNDTNNIYTRAKNAIGCGKPIMVFDNPECYYADSISLNGDGDVVIIKGGKTINITDANSVISEGIVSNPTMEKIKDLAGNLRFIETTGVIGSNVSTDVTISYTKASLSGSHLMLVVAGKIATSVTVGNPNQIIVDFKLDSWILDKIIPTISTTIEIKTINLYKSSYETDGTPKFYLLKTATGLRVQQLESITTTAEDSFRVQFDLLIDAE